MNFSGELCQNLMTKIAIFSEDGSVISSNNDSFFSAFGSDSFYRSYKNEGESVFPITQEEQVFCRVGELEYSAHLTPYGNGGCIAEVWSLEDALSILKHRSICEAEIAQNSAIRIGISEIFSAMEVLGSKFDEQDLLDWNEYLNVQANSCYSILSSYNDINEIMKYKLNLHNTTCFNASSLIAEIVSATTSHLRGDSTALSCECDKDIFIHADEERFTALVMSLVVDSILNNSSEEKSVSVALRRSGDNHCVLAVSTNGEVTENIGHKGSLGSSDMLVSLFCEAFGATSVKTSGKDGDRTISIRLTAVEADADCVKSRIASYISNRFSVFNLYLSRLGKIRLF